jgi:hypothetical protein
MSNPLRGDMMNVWRQEGPTTKGASRPTRPRTSPDMSFLEMLDVVNESSSERRGAHRLRPRLPRGHLRHVRLVINGVAHGPTRAPPPASCTCALQGRRHHHHRAVAGQSLPRASRTCRRPQRLRPHHQAGGYISVRTGGAPDANADADPKEDADEAIRRRGLHRLRRLRGRLPQRLGHALRRRQGQPPRAPAPGAARAPPARPEHGRARWTRRASATAPTTASARRLPQGDQRPAERPVDLDLLRVAGRVRVALKLDDGPSDRLRGQAIGRHVGGQDVLVQEDLGPHPLVVLAAGCLERQRGEAVDARRTEPTVESILRRPLLTKSAKGPVRQLHGHLGPNPVRKLRRVPPRTRGGRRDLSGRRPSGERSRVVEVDRRIFEHLARLVRAAREQRETRPQHRCPTRFHGSPR